MTFGLARGIVVESTGRDDDLASATGLVRQGRAAVSAESGGEAASDGKIVAGDEFLPRQPSDGTGLHRGVHTGGYPGRSWHFAAASFDPR
jgi:hypothetical protein